MQVNKILNIEQDITSNPSEIKDLAYCKTIKNNDSEQQN
jgi:hypothetical protein